ncbi:MAG: PA2778 family cysteine peptidase [Gammaproteobacteria bacterium]|nr:PA2778 family cysteine peptidase [Gammaproteobacteria bacterium]
MYRPSAARRSAGGFFILLVALLTGCATLQSERLAPAAFLEPVELTAVPFFPQTEYQCGPAALATVLTWAGTPVTPEQLTPQVYLPERRGSLQLELQAAVRRYGKIPYVLRPTFETLLTEVAAGHPVVVFQNLGLSWYSKWHYAVVVGFDRNRNALLLRSGVEQRHAISFTVFERTWRRGDYWAMAVLPPTELPKTAEEVPYLQSVATLERLKRWQETRVAYETTLTRWPNSLGAWLGLGNSRYALRDLSGAEQAYRAAVTAHPASGDALNNLAQTLAEQGHWHDAETMARRAIAAAGPRLDAYEATLTDILARRLP